MFRPLIWKHEGEITNDIIWSFSKLRQAWKKRGKLVEIEITLNPNNMDVLTLTVS